MLKIGDNPMGDDKIVTVEVDESTGDTLVTFQFWRDPTNGPARLTYSPGVTMAFISAQVDAAMRGDVPPFIS